MKGTPPLIARWLPPPPPAAQGPQPPRRTAARTAIAAALDAAGGSLGTSGLRCQAASATLRADAARCGVRSQQLGCMLVPH